MNLTSSGLVCHARTVTTSRCEMTHLHVWPRALAVTLGKTEVRGG